MCSKALAGGFPFFNPVQLRLTKISVNHTTMRRQFAIGDGDTAHAILITVAMETYFTKKIRLYCNVFISNIPGVSSTPVGVGMNGFGSFLLTKNDQNMAKMMKNLTKKCCNFFKSSSR